MPATAQTASIAPSDTPQHVAIIMDGNGRWAKQRGLPRQFGHKKGAEALKKLLTDCKGLGVEYLTVYAFSAENWNRPEEEVSALMGLLARTIDHEADKLMQDEVRFRTIGDLSTLQPDIRARVESLIERTKHHTQLNLTLALSYGAQQELLRAMKRLMAEGVSVDELTEERFETALDTHELPPLDLLIRTGGEQRLSNFLLWQAAYTELYFTDTFWPDFTSEHLSEALNCFRNRERRFGHV
jgi:undecaprenyl diphosphate synthase